MKYLTLSPLTLSALVSPHKNRWQEPKSLDPAVVEKSLASGCQSRLVINSLTANDDAPPDHSYGWLQRTSIELL